MLNDTGRDLAAVFAAVLLALVGAAYVIPVHIRQTSVVPRSLPASPQSPEPDVVLGISNDVPKYQWSLDQAITAWNTSGVQIRFQYVPAAEAQIVVTTAPKSACDSDPEVLACTELGHPAGERRTIWIVDQVDRYDEARVLVHELGHILGLTHDTRDGCVAMAPNLWQNCDSPPPGQWRCRLLAPADIARAVDLNGGTPNPTAGPVYCPTSTS